MSSETIFKVITLLYCSAYAASIKDQARTYNDWKGAYQTCQANSSHLPRLDSSLNFKDVIYSIDSSKQFWTEATYDAVDVNIFSLSKSFVFPSYCCGTANFVRGMIVPQCVDCFNMISYACIEDFNNGTDSVLSRIKTSTWATARDTCKSKGGLPDQSTMWFQHRMENSPNTYWINDLRALNITPGESNGKYGCVYWEKFVVVIGPCDQHGRDIQTICISEETNVPTVQSRRTFRTVSVLQVEEASIRTDEGKTSQARNENKPVPSKEVTTIDTTTSIYGKDTSYSLLPSVSTIILGTSYFKLPESTRQNIEGDLHMSANGIWPIVGGTLGAFVVIIVVVILSIILFRRHRTKHSHDTVLSSTENTSTFKVNVPTKTNDSYETVFEDSLALEEWNVTSNQISTAQNKEPVIYAQAKKVKETNRNLTQAAYENDNTGLYSRVQKDWKKDKKNSSRTGTKRLGKECYAISFMEMGNGESLENVYNKISVHSPEFQNEETINVYNRANFRFDEVKSGHTDDTKRSHRGESSIYDTTGTLTSTTDSTYDHL